MRGPCVDEELDATDGLSDSCCVESVPVVVEDRHKLLAKVSSEGVRDMDDVVKLWVVNGGVPYADFVARGKVDPRCGVFNAD